MIESAKESDIAEIFNAEIVPEFQKLLGENCIENTSVVNITMPVSLMHNYIPLSNMEKGIIKKDWDDKDIFVCD